MNALNICYLRKNGLHSVLFAILLLFFLDCIILLKGREAKVGFEIAACEMIYSHIVYETIFSKHVRSTKVCNEESKTISDISTCIFHFHLFRFTRNYQVDIKRKYYILKVHPQSTLVF